MKKFILFITVMSFVCADDSTKGQTYYQYIFKDALGYNGAVFAKKYTKAQWNTLFDNDANQLKEILIKENSTLKTFTKSKKFKKISPFLRAFVLNYAKDVNVSPSCN